MHRIIGRLVTSGETAAVSHALVLVVEDEPDLADVVRAYLADAGFRVVVERDGVRAERVIASMHPDLVVLDVNLPGIDGFEVLRRTRTTSDVPVLFLTARVDDIDRVVGFRLGGDDYVTKPFHPPELVERVRAVLRRNQRAAPGALRFGPLLVEPAATSCRVGETPVDLTAAEYQLLEHLARHPRQTFSRAQLLAAVLPESEASDRVIDAHLANVRRKLAAAGLHNAPITTLRGIGYRFDPPVEC
jgi:two-component system, OmpR family, response regulator AdeR